MLLVPEARKTAAFRLHTFADAEEAAAFIQRWFWPGTAGGVIAFWALHKRPLHASRGNPPEAIALVREDAGSDVVYCSSFRHMDSARSLVRAKAKRGLHLGLTLVYWAAPVAIEYDRPGHVSLTPSAPPALQPVRAAEPPPLEQQEQEPQTDALEEAAAAVEVAPEPPTEAPEHAAETAEVDGEPDGLPEPAAAPAAVEESAEVSAASAEVEETAEAQAEPDGLPEPAAAPAAVEESVEVNAGTNALGGEEAEGEAEVTTERLVWEVGKVLDVTRWDYRQEPFEGFDSPPGKF